MPVLTEERLGQILDQKLANLATRADLNATQQRLLNRIDEAQEELARIGSGGFEHVYSELGHIREQIDVKPQLEDFEQKFQRIEAALQIKL